MPVGEMLIGGYPPLLEYDELIAIVIGKLNEQVREVHVLKEPLFGMLVVSVARITYERLILIVERLAASRPLTAITGRATIAGCLLPKMVCTLRVSADVHVALYVLKVISFESMIDIGHESELVPLDPAISCARGRPVPEAEDVIEFFFSVELLEST